MLCGASESAHQRKQYKVELQCHNTREEDHERNCYDPFRKDHSARPLPVESLLTCRLPAPSFILGLAASKAATFCRWSDRRRAPGRAKLGHRADESSSTPQPPKKNAQGRGPAQSSERSCLRGILDPRRR